MKYHLTIDELQLDANITGYLEAKIKGQDLKVDLVRLDEIRYSAIVNHRTYIFEINKIDGDLFLIYQNRKIPFLVETEKDLMMKQMQKSSSADLNRSDIKAPMPGLVVKIEVSEGQTVSKGQGLIILEAMKMENEIKAPISGVVTKISVVEKQNVEKSSVLMVIG